MRYPLKHDNRICFKTLDTNIFQKVLRELVFEGFAILSKEQDLLLQTTIEQSGDMSYTRQWRVLFLQENGATLVKMSGEVFTDSGIREKLRWNWSYTSWEWYKIHTLASKLSPNVFYLQE